MQCTVECRIERSLVGAFSSSPVLLLSDVASPISRVPSLDHGTISTVPMHGTTTRGLIGARLRADMNIRREGDGTVH